MAFRYALSPTHLRGAVARLDGLTPSPRRRTGHIKGHMTLYSSGRLMEVRGMPTPEGWPSG